MINIEPYEDNIKSIGHNSNSHFFCFKIIYIPIIDSDNVNRRGLAN